MSGSKQRLQVAALAADDEHKHGHGEAKLVLDHGKKSQTDEVVRKGMEKARAVRAADLEAIHAGKQTAAQYQVLGATVNAEVANLVKNVKLDPRADAQFHQAIAELMAGAESMEGKEKTAHPRRATAPSARRRPSTPTAATSSIRTGNASIPY